jgi:hypothetical protein
MSTLAWAWDVNGDRLHARPSCGYGTHCGRGALHVGVLTGLGGGNLHLTLAGSVINFVDMARGMVPEPHESADGTVRFLRGCGEGEH